jgi:hypothetical protein
MVKNPEALDVVLSLDSFSDDTAAMVAPLTGLPDVSVTLPRTLP